MTPEELAAEFERGATDALDRRASLPPDWEINRALLIGAAATWEKAAELARLCLTPSDPKAHPAYAQGRADLLAELRVNGAWFVHEEDSYIELRDAFEFHDSGKILRLDEIVTVDVHFAASMPALDDGLNDVERFPTRDEAQAWVDARHVELEKRGEG